MTLLCSALCSSGKEAFRTGDFKWQRRMMDALMSGLENNLSNFTLWTSVVFNPLENLTASP